MTLHSRGRRKSDGFWQTRIVLGAVLYALLTTVTDFAYCEHEPRPLEIIVSEMIDMGDVMVTGRGTIEVEMATHGRRGSLLGQPVFGSLPYGAGRLHLLGEPNACVRLTAHKAGRSADSGRIRVTRVLLQASNVEEQEEIHLRLDSNGLAVVDVGVRLQLSAIERSDMWQLSLGFEAQYGDDCLY